MKLMRRLRDGCSIDDLLISARELSIMSHDPGSERTLMAMRQPHMTDPTHEPAPREGDDSESNTNAGQTRLPPISSFWYHNLP